MCTVFLPPLTTQLQLTNISYHIISKSLIHNLSKSHADGRTDGQTGMRMYGRTDRQTDGRRDRQTERHDKANSHFLKLLERK